MDDYISREEAKRFFNLNFGGVSHAIIASRLLDEIPAADVVPVVRCGECVHQYRRDYGPLAGARFCNVWCMINGMGDDGFCNYGERKEGADNES